MKLMKKCLCSFSAEERGCNCLLVP